MFAFRKGWPRAILPPSPRIAYNATVARAMWRAIADSIGREMAASGQRHADEHPTKAQLTMSESPRIVPLTDDLRPWAAQVLTDAWGSAEMVSLERRYQADQLPGFVALAGESEPAGLLTFAIEGDACEIITLNSLRAGIGVGSALIQAAAEVARAEGCRRLWLMTTNDNLSALGFYQRRGLRLVAVRPGAVDAARQLKPEMPLIGSNGIPLRDEIELELPLDERSSNHGEH